MIEQVTMLNNCIIVTLTILSFILEKEKRVITQSKCIQQLLAPAFTFIFIFPDFAPGTCK